MRRLEVEGWPLRRRLALVALQLAIWGALAWWVSWGFLLAAGFVLLVNGVNIWQNRSGAT
jgi:hypothetical protein